jgi:class 3 adenylate cyclase
MAVVLSLEEMAHRLGESVDRLGEWRRLGLIGAPGEDTFTHEDLERARVFQLLVRRGIGLSAIVRSLESGFLGRTLDQYLDALFPGEGRPAVRLAEAARQAGMPLDVARRLSETVSGGKQSDILSEADVRMLDACRFIVESGLPADALLQISKVLATSQAHAAEAVSRITHFNLHDRVRAAGTSLAETDRREEVTIDRITPLLEPAVLHFHRLGMARALPEDMVLHVLEEAGLATVTGVPGQILAAAVFVDLSSFTPLSEAMGDLKAAEVLDRFGRIVYPAVHRWNGRVVKQIGDGFMLVFTDAREAVSSALEIEARIRAEPQFPAVRSGLHWGRMLYREGDYVGTTVNIASRVSAEAERHQVLLTGAMWRVVQPMDGVDFERLGTRRLKGLAEETELFTARARQTTPLAKVVDPVCGMELGPGEAAARLTIEGTEHLFCSQECLRRFVAA